jgi:hypothetical protein
MKLDAHKDICLKIPMVDTMKSDKHQLLTWTCTNQTTSWLVRSLNVFYARTSHGQTWTHKTQHGLDLGEATTFPLIVYYVLGHETTPKCHFVPGLPSGTPEIPKVRTPTTFGPITSCVDLLLRWSLKHKCSSCWELSSSMWHTTFTQGNRGDSRI